MSIDSPQLKSDAKVGRRSLTGVIDADPAEAEILGFGMWGTVGEVLVPRDWLVEQFLEHGLDPKHLPRKPTPWQAYRRAMVALLDDGFETDTVQDHEVEFRMTDGEVNVRRLYANVKYTEAETGKEGGHVNHVDLGWFNFDSEEDRMSFHTEVEEDHILHVYWKKLVGRAQGLLRKMETHHNGTDLRGILQSMRGSPNSRVVKFRTGGVVYFWPARHAEKLESLSLIWRELNEFKKNGFRCELVTLPVVDDESHREIIRQHVEEELESRVTEAIGEGLQKLTEDDETSPEAVAEEVFAELSEASSIADEYSQLLEVKLSVQRHIREWKEGLKQKESDLVDEILAQETL